MPEALAARDEFFVRFFHWSLREWEREIAADLHLLRKVHRSSGYRWVRFFESLPREQWAKAARALTKRFHPEALALLGQPLDDQERALVERAMAFQIEPDAAWLTAPHAIKRKRVATIIKSALSSLGVAEPTGASTEWRYASRFKSWSITTHLDVGGRFADVDYHHDIAIGEERPFVRFVSLLSWLGLSSQTKWSVLTEDDAVLAAQAIAELTQHFLAAVPSLIGDE